MKDEKMIVSFGNAFEISAETENALSKLPTKAQEIAREITRKQIDSRNNANKMLAGIQSSADELTKETAKRVLALVQSYNMDKDENAPFKNWGEFAKSAWNKSASWVTQNKRVAAEILNSKDKSAQELSANFNFSQLAELLPLTKEGISPHIADGLKDGTLRPDMKASTEIREWVKQFLPDSVTKVRLSDVYFVESGKRLDAVNLDNYITEDENTAVLSFNPNTVDADTDTAWKGKVCVDLQTMGCSPTVGGRPTTT